MILFEWDKVLRHSKYKNAEIVFIIWYITYKPIARYATDYRVLRYREIDWRGNSFIKNPELLLKNEKKYTKVELGQYIALAARRNYAEYKTTGNLGLSVLMVDDLEPLRKNRLLTITGTEVLFKYEEM